MQESSSTTSSDAASSRYSVLLVAAVVLPNLVAAVVFLLDPQLFYFRAWEYMSDVVYRVEGASLEWRGPEAGDLSRSTLLSAQQTWTTRVSVDELGFRRVPLEADQYPVAVAGDSSVFGSGLSDDQTFPWLLAERLGVPVFNGGRTTFDNLLKHPRLKQLRLVIDMRGEEALPDHFTPLDPDTPFAPLREPRGSLLFSVPPERYLPAPVLMRLASRLLRDVIGANRGASRSGWLFTHFTHQRRQLDAIVEGAVARAAELRARGIDYVFIPVPKKQTIYGPDHGLQVDDYSLNFTAILTAALRARGVATVDLVPALRAARDEQVFFATDTHWTARGVEVSLNAVLSQPDVAARLRAAGAGRATARVGDADAGARNERRRLADH